MKVELWVKNGYEEIKDAAGGNRSISVIWTECSRILSQGTNWEHSLRYWIRKERSLINSGNSKPKDKYKPVGFEQIRFTRDNV
jgi:hypothetical protein